MSCLRLQPPSARTSTCTFVLPAAVGRAASTAIEFRLKRYRRPSRTTYRDLRSSLRAPPTLLDHQICRGLAPSPPTVHPGFCKLRPFSERKRLPFLVVHL